MLVCTIDSLEHLIIQTHQFHLVFHLNLKLIPYQVVYQVFSMYNLLHVHLFFYIYQVFHLLFLLKEPKFFFIDIIFTSIISSWSVNILIILIFLVLWLKLPIQYFSSFFHHLNKLFIFTVYHDHLIHFHHMDLMKEYVNIFLKDNNK